MSIGTNWGCAVCVAAATGVFTAGVANADIVTITFDDPEVESGSTMYAVEKAIFTTTDVFNPLGPDPDGQKYLKGPHLEMIASLGDDVIVDFVTGAVDFVSYGFALSVTDPGPNVYAEFEAFDANDQSLGSVLVLANGGTGVFVEGELTLNFSGVASYGVIRFSGAERGAIDNFTFVQVPAPGALALLAAAGILGTRRRR